MTQEGIADALRPNTQALSRLCDPAFTTAEPPSPRCLAVRRRGRAKPQAAVLSFSARGQSVKKGPRVFARALAPDRDCERFGTCALRDP